MASERKPELCIVDTLKDKHGRTVKVGWRGADVEIIVTPHSGHDGRIALDGEQRDRFIKAWSEAEREAETWAGRPCCDHCNNLAGDPDGHDYGDKGAHDGPCAECAAEHEAASDA